ncbi:hypothetical protein [Streptomyces mirabilis]|uniref:hypothetical protein n=1 Tax=Streptomyces mirabilis TaxID=68239 RepID=UPI0033243285
MRGHEAVSFGGSQSAEHGWGNEPRNAPELRWEHVARDTAVEPRSEPVPASALELTDERSVCPREWGDRVTHIATMLPGLAAVAALVFTWVSVTQVSEELEMSKQGQIADRYDKALERLSGNSANIRRGAIFSLQGIMEDSPRQQPAVIDALSGYIRTHATKNMSAEKAPDVSGCTLRARPSRPFPRR